MALVAATVASGGVMPSPQVTLGEAPIGSEAYEVVTPGDARRLLAAWRRCEEGPATEGGPRGHWGLAVAGEGEPHAWFMGMAPSTDDAVYAVAVLVEHATDPERAFDVGVALLQAAARR